MIDVLFAKAAVNAVGEDDQIGIGKPRFILDLDLELQPNAKLARALLQDQQQLSAGAAAKAVAADAVHGAAEVHGDIVPVSEFLGDPAIARWIVFLEIVEGGVGKHHAEAEGVISAVALIDRDRGLRPLLFEKDRSIKPRRSTADDCDLHEASGKLPVEDILNLKYMLASPDLILPASIPLEDRLHLVGEGNEGALEIGRGHAERLRHRFGLD